MLNVKPDFELLPYMLEKKPERAKPVSRKPVKEFVIICQSLYEKFHYKPIKMYFCNLKDAKEHAQHVYRFYLWATVNGDIVVDNTGLYKREQVNISELIKG